MEFRRFLLGLVQVPAQIVRTDRRIECRVQGYTEWLRDFLETVDRIRVVRLT
jgi:hypothetical protein